MIRFLSWFVAVPIAVAAVLFAISNRAPVTIDAWPLPYAITLPLFAVVLGTLAVGLVLGGLIAWLSAGRTRRRARAAAREAETAGREARALRERVLQLEAERSGDRKSLPSPLDAA